MTYASDQSICLAVQKAGFSFIFVCLPSSHKTLYEWIDFLDKTNKIQQYTIQRRIGKKHRKYDVNTHNKNPNYPESPDLTEEYCTCTP